MRSHHRPPRTIIFLRLSQSLLLRERSDANAIVRASARSPSSHSSAVSFYEKCQESFEHLYLHDHERSIPLSVQIVWSAAWQCHARWQPNATTDRLKLSLHCQVLATCDKNYPCALCCQHIQHHAMRSSQEKILSTIH